MSTDLWEHHPGTHPAADPSLVGYEVLAIDGPLGRVEQDTGDHLLVDAAPWVPGARVPVPFGLVARVDHLERSVRLDCTRAHLSAVPPTAVDLTTPRPR